MTTIRGSRAHLLRLGQLFMRTELPVQYGGSLECLTPQQINILNEHEKKGSGVGRALLASRKAGVSAEDG